MPQKYYDMHDFHEYYSGARTAPYLTIFIGGNHEASNYMWELYYGGWVAPKIYYMGAANVIRLGPLRIAGLSGIWKGYSFKKPHHERLPYNQDDIKSVYHVRELDTRKLLQLRSQVDVGLSHDWPRGMEWKGNHEQLFRYKQHFQQEAKDGTLGSVAAATVLNRLRPKHWFSAHMHVKYAATWEHESDQTKNLEAVAPTKNASEIELGLQDDAPVPIPKNEAEIDLDMDDEDEAPKTSHVVPKGEPAIAKNDDEIELDMDDIAEEPKPSNGSKSPAANGANQGGASNKPEEIPHDIRTLLPESFSRPRTEPALSLPFPAEITNTTTQFLALDKCLPNRHFLQLLEIIPHEKTDFQRPLQLSYDKEWLAITRVFAKDLQVGDPYAHVPPDKGDAVYRPLIEREMEWVEENIAKKGKMTIPEDFEQTAPVYDPTMGIRVDGLPQEYTNPHTWSFCRLLEIPNPFHASDEERAQMMQRGPRPETGGSARGGRGWGNRGGGGGQSRGRGGRGGRGRGRGRGH